MQLELSYSMNERVYRESLLFIYTGESPTTTATEEFNAEEIQVLI